MNPRGAGKREGGSLGQSTWEAPGGLPRQLGAANVPDADDCVPKLMAPAALLGPPALGGSVDAPSGVSGAFPPEGAGGAHAAELAAPAAGASVGAAGLAVTPSARAGRAKPAARVAERLRRAAALDASHRSDLVRWLEKDEALLLVPLAQRTEAVYLEYNLERWGEEAWEGLFGGLRLFGVEGMASQVGVTDRQLRRRGRSTCWQLARLGHWGARGPPPQDTVSFLAAGRTWLVPRGAPRWPWAEVVEEGPEARWARAQAGARAQGRALRMWVDPEELLSPEDSEDGTAVPAVRAAAAASSAAEAWDWGFAGLGGAPAGAGDAAMEGAGGAPVDAECDSLEGDVWDAVDEQALMDADLVDDAWDAADELAADGWGEV